MKLRRTLAIAAAAGLWAGSATAGIVFTNTTPRSVLIETEGAKGSCSNLLAELSLLGAPPFLPPYPNSRLGTPDCTVYAAAPGSGPANFTNQADDYFAVLSKLTPGTAPNLPGGGVDPWRLTVPVPVWTAALTRTLAQSQATFLALKATQIVDFDRSTGAIAPGNVANAQCTASPGPGVGDDDTCCDPLIVGAGTCSAVYYEATGVRAGIPIRLSGIPSATDYPFFGNAADVTPFTPARRTGNGCFAAGFPDACCTGPGTGSGAGYCGLLLPDPGAPLTLSCSSAKSLPLTPAVLVGTPSITSATVNPDGSTTLVTGVTAGLTSGVGNVLTPTAATVGAIVGVDYQVISVSGGGATIVVDEGINPPPFPMAVSKFSPGDTFIVNNYQAGGTGTLYGPAYPGDAAVPTTASPCPTVLPAPPGYAIVGSDTMLTTFVKARITARSTAPPVPEPSGTPAAWGVIDWRIDETVDTDTDGTPDPIDNCTTIAQVPVFAGSTPGSCDTDKDGLGNACDGDFNQNWSVTGTDFSPLFLSNFTAGADSGIGSDMNCSGAVTGTDFSPFFLGQFTKGTPGASGFACAASMAANPIDQCTGPKTPYPCCTGVKTGIAGSDVITQFCACP